MHKKKEDRVTNTRRQEYGQNLDTKAESIYIHQVYYWFFFSESDFDVEEEVSGLFLSSVPDWPNSFTRE